ncbi:MAG: M48 family metalloprotease [Acidobacteria bacterium]|nr:M48 family metalloprotease [Acidobacteriota bacterium]
MYCQSSFRYLTLFLCIALCPVFAAGQQSAPMNEFTLGIQQRNEIMSSFRVLRNTKANELSERVFRTLLATSVVRNAGRDLDWELTLLASDDVNAFTTANGKVYVTTAMIESVLGQEYGLWAAVLGHEIGHGLGNHIHKAYVRHHEHELQRINLLNLSNQGQTWASWALVAHTTVGSLAKLKVSRDEESEADYLGLMMMAESGVHPDHSIAVCRRMYAMFGDRGKVWTFLSSDHPRWATREENAWRNWTAAISRFRNRWNDPVRSPGGMPPPIVGFGKTQVVKDSKSKSVSIAAPYLVRNVNEAFIGVVFEHKGKVIQSALAEYRFDNGALGVMRPARISSGIEDSQFSINIPALALVGKERTLDAFLVVWANGKVIGYSEKLKVSFPKP